MNLYVCPPGIVTSFNMTTKFQTAVLYKPGMAHRSPSVLMSEVAASDVATSRPWICSGCIQVVFCRMLVF